MNLNFWNGKKVFLTGHTGFKGSWTSLWLKKLGSKVKGYSLEPNTNPSLFEVLKLEKSISSEVGDIRNLDNLHKSMQEFEPDIVLHMAAQPLVRDSYKDPIKTYNTNVIGTVNLFEAVRKTSSIKAVVNITSDKCYQNNEWERGYHENDPMGGYDPYSNSKGCSELITSSYRNSFFNSSSTVSLASVRAGNVIGGGDWAKDRIIPDILKAFDNKEPIIIRNPNAVRPWQHVLEPISGYLTVAEKLFLFGDKYAQGWNFGPKDKDAMPVRELLDYLVNHWKEESSWIQDSKENPHEAMLLKLDITKAREELNWEPFWDLEKTLQTIIEWHNAWLAGKDMSKTTLNQIEDYEQNIRKKYEQR